MGRYKNDRGVGGHGVCLSPQMHQEYSFRHKSACRTPAESGQEDMTRGKEYIEHTKLRRMKGLGEKTGVLVGLDLPSAGGGISMQRSNPRIGAIV